MIRKLILTAVVLGTVFGAASVDAAERVRGYYRSNGTYVQPYYRSSRDGSFYNNWSTKPNFNPYTGRQGTRVTPPYSSYPSSSRSSSSSIWSWFGW